MSTQYKNQQTIEEFRKRWGGKYRLYVDPGHGQEGWFESDEWRNIEQFLDEQLTKKEEEVRKDIYYDLMTARNAIMQVLGKSLKTQNKK